MSRPISLIANTDAMRENFRFLKRLANRRFIWCVVKANAYGHGLKAAVDAFSEADGLAVISVEEALELRQLGWTKRILLLEGLFSEDEIELVAKTNSEPVISTYEQITWLKEISLKFPEKISVYIKANTGLNRLGFNSEVIESVASELATLAFINLEGVVTHFANAEPGYPTDGIASCKRQLQRLSEIHYSFKEYCLANTACILFHPEIQGSQVRAGIGLYGAAPDDTLNIDKIGLKVTQSLVSKIIAKNYVKKGEGISYGSKYITKRDSVIAVVACGYADGYPRTISSNACVYINGKRASIVGTVAMDMLMIDISDIDNVKIGDVVELWGENIKISEVAQWSGTISYDLMCSVTKRVKKIIL